MASTGSHYGKPNKAIHVGNVRCRGDEASLRQCSKTEYGLNDVPGSDVNVAGVSCVPNADLPGASNAPFSDANSNATSGTTISTIILAFMLAIVLIIGILV